jgi:hypothetical protein
MSEVRDPDTDQPLPKPGQKFVQEFMINELRKHKEFKNIDVEDAIVRGIEARRELGVRKYGTALQTFNGRDATVEAWEEAIDLLTYTHQIEMEDGDTGSLIDIALEILARLTMRRLNRGDCF